MVEYDDFDTVVYPEDVIEDEQNCIDDLSDQCVDAMIEPPADDFDVLNDIDEDDCNGLEDDGEDPEDILYDIEDGELEESILDSVSSTLDDIENANDGYMDDEEDEDDDEYFEYLVNIEDLE